MASTKSMLVAFGYSTSVKSLSHPAFLILAFAVAGLIVAGWWYGRKNKRSHSDEMPTIPASEITRPGRTAAPAPIPPKKHTTQEVLKRALRRGDKALGNIEGSSLPFLDTSPLTHRDPEKADINTSGGKQTVRAAPSDRQ